MSDKYLIRFVDLEQGTDEWKQFRKWKIGSSMAASIRGKGFKTPLQTFEDIIEDKENVTNKAMLHGTITEPKAREWLNKKYRSDLQPVVVQHPNHEMDWHISSIDGLWKRPDGSIFVTEIKCPGRADHQTALEGNVPEKYLPQCFHILEDLPGVDKILYFSYRDDNDVAEVWIHRNEYEMHIQFAEELSFFTRLLTCTPPDPIDKDWVSIYDDSAIARAEEYASLMNQILCLQEQADCLKKALINNIGTCCRAKIGELKLQRVIRQGAVDYSKIEVLKGLDTKPYRKAPIITWRAST